MLGIMTGTCHQDILTQNKMKEITVHLEKEMATTPVFLPGKSHGQRSLVGYSPKSIKESDTTKPLSTVQYIHVYAKAAHCV